MIACSHARCREAGKHLADAAISNILASDENNLPIWLQIVIVISIALKFLGSNPSLSTGPVLSWLSIYLI